VAAGWPWHKNIRKKFRRNEKIDQSFPKSGMNPEMKCGERGDSSFAKRGRSIPDFNIRQGETSDSIKKREGEGSRSLVER
jgi:hypothetical protein